MLLVSLVAVFAACASEEVKIKSIAVKPGQETQFTLGEFSLGNLFIVVTDSNGNSFDKGLSESMFSEDDLAKLKVAGEHTVTVNYGGYSTQLTVTLVDNAGGGGGNGTTPTPTNIVTVSFESNGGSKVDSQSGNGSVTISSEPKPTNGNYTFGGWYTDQKLTNRAEFPFTATMNVTLYANWDKPTVTVHFDVNASGVSPITDYKVEMGSRIVFPTAIVREGYDFAGWFEDQACTKPVSSDKVFNAETTLFAGYKIKTYTVTFDLAGGKYYTFSEISEGKFVESSKETVKVEYEYGATIKNLPTVDREHHVEGFGREDFVFRCWEMDGEQYTLDTMPARNITITAAWNIEDPATFFTYSDNGDGTVTITGYRKESGKNATEITIPSIIDGKKVVAIGRNAFEGRSKLKSVNIPNGVKYIYANAFKGTSLTGEHTSSIPSSLLFVGPDAFPSTWEYKTKEVTVGNDTFVLGGIVGTILVKYTTDMGYNVVIPEGITAISAGAFKGCTTIRQIEIGKDVIYIGENAFQNSGLEKVTFAKGSIIRTIDPTAFDGTDWLESAESAGDPVVFGSLLFRDFTEGDSVTVSADVKYINESAFAQKVKNITFENEKNIQYIAADSVSVTRWATNQNMAVVNGILVYVKRSTASTVYQIPDTVTTIAGKAFDEVKSTATNVVLPSSVRTICDYAFLAFGSFNLTLQGNTPPTMTLKAFAKNELGGLVDVNVFVNDAATVSYADENSGNGWYYIQDRINAVKVAKIEKVEGVDSTYGIGGEIDLDKIKITYRTNDNLVYSKTGLTRANVSDYDELTLYAGEHVMSINFGITGNKEASYNVPYSVFKSIGSLAITGVETSYFVGETLKSASQTTAEAVVHYVTYRDPSSGDETLDPVKYALFVDGQLAPTFSVKGFSTVSPGAYSMTITYREEIKDTNGKVVHVLEKEVEVSYTVRERDIAKIELTGFKPDDKGNYVFTQYTPAADGNYVLAFTFKADDNGEYMEHFAYKQNKNGLYVVKGVVSDNGLYVYDESDLDAKGLVLYDETLHAGMTRYDVDLVGATYEHYEDGDIGLRFERFIDDYVPYDGVSNVARFNRIVADYISDYTEGTFGERYSNVPGGSYELDDGTNLWYGGLAHYSHDAMFGKTSFGILEQLDLDNIYVKCTYNQPDEKGNRVEYLPLRGFVVSGFDTSAVSESDVTATVTYGKTEVTTTFTYSVGEYTALSAFNTEVVGDKVVIKGLNEGYPSVVYLPSTIDGKAVEIADGAFKGLKGLDKVVIRAGLTLGTAIFENSDVKTVEFDADGSYVSLPEATFRGTTALTTVVLPASMTEIGKEAFKNSAITEFVVPNGIKVIKERAFAASGLTSITFGASLKQIGLGAFENCGELASVTFGSTAGSLIIGKAAFMNCTSLTAVVLPANVTDVPEYAFYGNVVLTSVAAQNLQSIGKNAFDGCTALTSFEAVSVASIGDSAFGGAILLETFACDLSQIVSVGKNAFDGCAVLNVDIGKMTALASIGDYAFRGTAITALTIPGNVSELGKNVFEGVDSLVSVDLSMSVLTVIDDGMFGGFTSLETVKLPSALTAIGKNAFKGTAITEIVFPATLETIGDSAFENCLKLATVTFGTGLKTIGNYAFASDGELKSVVIPATVTEIGASAFGETGLETVTFESGSKLTAAGEKAFYHTSITALTVPASVTVLGAESFANNTKLGTLTFESDNSLIEIGAGAFRQNVALATVNWNAAKSDVTTAVGSRAFEDCSLIETLTIPYTVGSIGEKAFYNCVGLKTLSIGAEKRDFYTVATTAEIGQAKKYLAGESTVKAVIYDKQKNGTYVEITEASDIVTDDNTKLYYTRSVEMAVQVDQTRSKLTTVGELAFGNTFKLEDLYITVENPKTFGKFDTNANNRQFGYINVDDNGTEQFVSHFASDDFRLHIVVKSEVTVGTSSDNDYYTTWTNNKRVLVQDIHFKHDLNEETA